MSRLLNTVRSLVSAPTFESESTTRVARIVHQLWLALASAAVIASVLDIIQGTAATATWMLIGGPVLYLAYRLNRTGRPREGGLLMLLMMLAVVTAIMMTSNGIRDIAMAALPVLILMSALFLDRRGVILFATLDISAAALIVYTDINGLFGLETLPAPDPRLSDFLYMALILSMAAIAAHTAIDSLNRSLERAQSSEKSLERRNAELERMTYSLSHELKSPLVTMKGFLGRINQALDREDLERVRRDLKRVDKATTRLHEQVKDLLQLTRLDHASEERADVSLEDVVQQGVERLEGQLDEA